jgi:hypothetical protein
MPSICCLGTDESADVHHSGCEIMTFACVLWGALPRQEIVGWHRDKNYTCTKWKTIRNGMYVAVYYIQIIIIILQHPAAHHLESNVTGSTISHAHVLHVKRRNQ